MERQTDIGGKGGASGKGTPTRGVIADAQRGSALAEASSSESELTVKHPEEHDDKDDDDNDGSNFDRRSGEGHKEKDDRQKEDGEKEGPSAFLLSSLLSWSALHNRHHPFRRDLYHLRPAPSFPSSSSSSSSRSGTETEAVPISSDSLEAGSLLSSAQLTWKTTTFGGFERLVDGAMRWLGRLRIGRRHTNAKASHHGVVVLMLASNDVVSTAISFGLIKAQLPVFPIAAAELTTDIIVKMLYNARIGMRVVEDERDEAEGQKERVVSVLYSAMYTKQANALRGRWYADKVTFQPLLSFKELEKESQQSSTAPVSQIEKENDDVDSTCLLLHSSGSHRSAPVVCRYTHRTIVGAAKMTRDEEYTWLPNSCGETILVDAPLHTIMGWTMGPLAALSGGRVPAYIPIGPTPRSKVVVDLVQSCHASQALLTTKQLEELHRKPDSVKILASLRCVWYSGAKLALGAKMRLEQAGVRLLSMYYVTEAGPLGMTHQTPKPGTEPCSGEWITLRSDLEFFLDSVGKDAEGKKLHEIVVLDTPGMKLNIDDRFGVFRTGDLCEIMPSSCKEEEGQQPLLTVKIRGRKEGLLILTTGESIQCAPFEHCVERHPLVKHCILFGHLRELVGVLIELESSADGRDEEVMQSLYPTIDALNNVMPTYARVFFPDMIVLTETSRPLPLTPKGSVCRSDALDLYQVEIRNVYETVLGAATANARMVDGTINGGTATGGHEATPLAALSHTDIMRFVCETVLAYIEPKSCLSPNMSLLELGLDSLRASLIRAALVRGLEHALEAGLGGPQRSNFEPSNLPSSFCFEHPTIAGLSAALERFTFDDAGHAREQVALMKRWIATYSLREVKTPLDAAHLQQGRPTKGQRSNSPLAHDSFLKLSIGGTKFVGGAKSQQGGSRLSTASSFLFGRKSKATVMTTDDAHTASGTDKRRSSLFSTAQDLLFASKKRGSVDGLSDANIETLSSGVKVGQRPTGAGGGTVFQRVSGRLASAATLRRTRRASRVLLFGGSTGALGCALVETLVARSDVSRVCILVRRKANGWNAQQRQVECMKAKSLHHAPALDPKVVYLLVNGLEGASNDEEDEDEVETFTRTNKVDTIIHGAWRVNFSQPLAEFEGLVRSVTRSINVARRCGAKLVFISSLAAVARAGELEDSSLDYNSGERGSALSNQPLYLGEDDLCPLEWAAGGYGASKAVAERLVSGAIRADPSLRGFTIRLGQLMGDSRTGRWNANEWVPILLRSAAHVGAFPSHETLGPVDWLAVDQAADIVATIALSSRLPSPSETNVVNVAHLRKKPWSAAVQAFSNHLPRHVKIVTLDEWLEKLKQAIEEERERIQSEQVARDAVSGPMTREEVERAIRAKIPAVVLVGQFEQLAGLVRATTLDIGEAANGASLDASEGHRNEGASPGLAEGKLERARAFDSDLAKLFLSRLAPSP